MEVLKSSITIGNYWFDFVHQVTVESSWKEFTDKAVIMLPAALKIDYNDLKKAIPVGSEVSVKIGYEGTPLTEIFKGYVARVRSKVPVEIECEDEMWNLKRIQINENCKNEKLGDYLQRVLNVPVDAFDVTIPSKVVSKKTGAQLLDEIKEEYGFHSFFRKGWLVVGKQYSDSSNQRHTVIIDQSSDCNVKSQNLEYMAKEDVKIKVTAISNMANGKKEEVEFGDPDGEERTLNFFNIPKSQLQPIAEAEAEKLKYDGYRGDLKLFGAPIVFHGDILTLQNSQDSDKTGDYYIDGVKYSFGVSGIEQDVQPGPKASA
ncbi:MAG: hypothetical protein J0G96_07145 [Flavobacteriia bacterium]|nr:hypothetical protein [Flavobacteriia bacterium]OJX36644.1 MAG: hypothetical protein BGO87_12655 [Flavobacteriia bacterium 40-80]